MEHDPSAFADHPAVVHDAGVAAPDPSKRSEAAAVVPPGTRPRSNSDATRPASTRRARSPTLASRPVPKSSDGRGGSATARARSTRAAWHEPEELRVTRRCVAGGRQPVEIRVPAGMTTDASRRVVPWSRSQLLTYASAAIGIEQLAVGEAQKRLMATQKLKIAGVAGDSPGRRRLLHRTWPAPSSSPPHQPAIPRALPRYPVRRPQVALTR